MGRVRESEENRLHRAADLARQLIALDRMGATGTLWMMDAKGGLTNPPGVARLGLRGGAAVSFSPERTASPDPRLGAMLLGAELPREALPGPPRALIGESLVAARRVTPGHLSFCLRRQLRRRLLGLALGAGEDAAPLLCRFVPGRPSRPIEEPERALDLALRLLRGGGERGGLADSSRRTTVRLSEHGARLLPGCALTPDEQALLARFPQDHEGAGVTEAWLAAGLLRERRGGSPLLLLEKQAAIRRGASPLELLGLRGSPTSAEVDKAYRTLVARLHPDRFGAKGSAPVLRASNEVIRALTRARNVCRDSVRGPKRPTGSAATRKGASPQPWV